MAVLRLWDVFVETYFSIAVFQFLEYDKGHLDVVSYDFIDFFLYRHMHDT